MYGRCWDIYSIGLTHESHIFFFHSIFFNLIAHSVKNAVTEFIYFLNKITAFYVAKKVFIYSYLH